MLIWRCVGGRCLSRAALPSSHPSRAHCSTLGSFWPLKKKHHTQKVCKILFKPEHRHGLVGLVPLKTPVPTSFGWGSSFCCAVSLQGHPYLGGGRVTPMSLCTSVGPSDASALPTPSSPPRGTAPRSSSKLKKQTEPFFPVVFPVCLRNIIFPRNEKNNNNLQEGPKHELVSVRFQSKQALKNKFLRYSSHV